MSSSRQPRPPTLHSGVALFHDFDGSLVEIASEPTSVTISHTLTALLLGVQKLLGGAFAIVSGRRLADIDGYFPGCAFAGAGVHGAELRHQAGGAVLSTLEDQARSTVAALRRHFGEDDRILIEDKQISVALHYRLAPERADECERCLRMLAVAEGLSVQPGKMVLEALPSGIDKGHAVHRLMSEPPFVSRLPVYVGDDVTDEHGIAAAQMLGGFGIKVGAGSSIAQYRLATVDEVHRWLTAALRPSVSQRSSFRTGAR